MRPIVFVMKIGLALLLVLIMSKPLVFASQRGDKEFTELCQRAKVLIQRYYPEADFSLKDRVFIGKYKTRTFMIHFPLKTGEWQEARATEGPDRHGIQCSIASAQGKYMGAAVVPQTFNCRYYQSLMLAPYNKSFDSHLIAHLDYPDGISNEFLREFQSLVESYSF